MKMKLERSSLYAGILLLVMAAGAGLCFFVLRAPSHPRLERRRFEVLYVWDHGLKNFQIINATAHKVGKNPKWRRLVTAEVRNYLPGLVSFHGFTRTVGTLHV
jgi:hypothetical protein